MWGATLIRCPGLRQLSTTSRWGRLFRRRYALATNYWMDGGGAAGFDSRRRRRSLFLLEEQRLQGIRAPHNRTAHKGRNWRTNRNWESRFPAFHAYRASLRHHG